jgi:hypothetical protein
MVRVLPAGHSQFDFDGYSRFVTDDVGRFDIIDELANTIITCKLGASYFKQTFLGWANARRNWRDVK